MSLLFDDNISRSDTEAADYLEPYAYLNRSGRKVCIDARERIDRWYHTYAVNNPNEALRLRQNFCSEDNGRCLSAYTELYVHHLLADNGLVVESHPNVPGSVKRPDFLVKKDGQGLFYVECRALVGNDDSVRRQRYQDEILAVLNQLNSPDFLVSMVIRKRDTVPLQRRKLREYLQKEIDKLDYDSVFNVDETEQKTLPPFVWRQNNWNIEFVASPIPREERKARDADSRVVGWYLSGITGLTLHKQIHAAVRGKAGKYGRLGLPYLIVINVINDAFFLEDGDVMDALFGEAQMVFTEFSDGTQEVGPSRTSRTMQGVFIRPPGKPINQRVSGVLVLKDAQPRQAIHTQKLWLHPFASRPFERAWLNVPYKIYNSEAQQMEDWSA